MMILDLMDENPGVAPHLERLRASDVSIYPLLSTRKRITKCLKLMPTAYQEPIGRRYRSNPIITIDWVKVDEVLA